MNKVPMPIGRGVRARKDCRTLRIKKKYFDAIKNGSKPNEYRNNTPFYQRLFKAQPNFVYLHYQGEVGLVVQVKSLRLIKKPTRFKDSEMLTTDKVFKISLGKSRVVSNI